MREDNRQLIDYAEVGRRIRDLRMSHGWTIKEVSKMANIEESALSNFERGAKRVGLTSLLLISDVFDVSIDYLLHGKYKKVERELLVVYQLETFPEAERRAIMNVVTSMIEAFNSTREQPE